ncbi:IclR family transcriptional regulator [Mesorhizobium australicum]|uniref:Transcriptional regulator, IclR family n=1 Tax=Mesorhizobium australicum TaxID=536018 RepID=A0A1X7NV00_9HYPH|nr:helix-turn-helix domain-containing protein [Mesorhizobium australicum]SMH42030.1 transcriptional regulator, IclR family [Mesorhizobium australicum]
MTAPSGDLRHAPHMQEARLSQIQVKSATRVIQIFELFDRHRKNLAMTEIALELGYPHSSTTVLLKTLVNMGYLNFDRHSRTYFPTPRFFSITEWIPDAFFPSNSAVEAMKFLHSRTGEGVGINMKNDLYVQYIMNLHSVHALRFVIDTGSQRLLTHSGIGWTLLSTMPDKQVDNYVRRANLVAEKSMRVDVDFILKRVSEIRRNGFCYVENVPFLGGATLAALLKISVHNQPVALSLGGALERMRANYDAYLEALFESVRLAETATSSGEPL